MIAADTAKDQKIALFGLGGSGLATARSLMAGGADLVCFDDNPASVEKAAGEGLPTGDLREVDFAKIDALILAPGVPLTHPKPHWTVELANAAGVPVIGDIELFARERRAKAPTAPFIAITGTNGKSTTTALIAHVLAHAGRDVQMGGNIGRAVLLLDEPTPERIYVVECSSYQIDLAPGLDPSVGILLNLAPDHLDRHGNMENYATVKKRLVQASELAIVGMDDVFSIEIAADLVREGIGLKTISGSANAADVTMTKGWLVEGGTRLFAMEDAPALRGDHNGQNAAAAWVACRSVGLEPQEIAAGFESFPGLAHRMERLGKQDRVLFVNDSKGTNADAAARALSSYQRIYWIAGGLAKEGGIESLRPYFGRIAKAYLIGEAAPSFAATIGNEAPYEISGTLAQAVDSAARDAGQDAHDEPVVLLSPACASFDQFPNFEKRGEAFREAVGGLEKFISARDIQSQSRQTEARS